MAHQYQVHMSDGQSYTVHTPHHHDDHPDKTFRDHLIDIIKGSVSGVISGYIIRYTHKGRI